MHLSLNALPQKIFLINHEEEEALETIVMKGENAGNLHFLLFPKCFLSSPKIIEFLSSINFVVCNNAFILDKTRIYLAKDKLFTTQSRDL